MILPITGKMNYSWAATSWYSRIKVDGALRVTGL